MVSDTVPTRTRPRVAHSLSLLEIIPIRVTVESSPITGSVRGAKFMRCVPSVRWGHPLAELRVSLMTRCASADEAWPTNETLMSIVPAVVLAVKALPSSEEGW
jgi:hypothetical protein